ncbi:MAG TPA: diguanylate cyclase [Pseudomonadales bacterium]|nr:diguanylate cyclase [Pseudomonadales bacterium]
MRRGARLAAVLFALILLAAGEAAAEPVSLAGDWKFHPGDDPAWAAPALDDSDWDRRRVPDAWASPGLPEYGQRAWYRLHFDLADAAAEGPRLAIRMGAVRNAYELYVDGNLLGGVGRLPPDPEVNFDLIRIYPLPADVVDRGGEVVIALRVWGGSDLAVATAGGGPYAGAFLVGDEARLLRGLDAEQMPRLIMASLFLLIGTYFIYLFLRSRALTAFFWFGFTALVLVPYLITQSQWKYVLGLPFVTMEKIESVTFFMFLIAFIQLIWSAMGRTGTWRLRIWQGALGLLALAMIVTPGLEIHYRVRLYWQAAVLLGVVPVLLTVIGEVRAGNRDARTLLYGQVLFLLAALNDLLINMGVHDGMRLLPVGFLAMLASMGVILANRFTSLLDELEQQVDERTRELSEANAALADANESLQAMSRLDPLTGLLNRRGFLTEVEVERQRVLRSGAPLSLLLLDVDFFKKFNDEYGHACGDLVLQEVARVMAAQTREVDRVGRWGGEEFILLLPDTDPAALAQVAEKVRSAVSAHRVEFEGTQLGVTITLGGAVYRPDESIDACIERADQALYAGKANGRNRAEIAA